MTTVNCFAEKAAAGRKTERNDIQLCAVAAVATAVGLAAGAGADQNSGGGVQQLAVKVLTWGKKSAFQ